MSPNNQVKFKAVLQAINAQDISDAVNATIWLEEYEISPYAENADDFYKQYLHHKIHPHQGFNSFHTHLFGITSSINKFGFHTCQMDSHRALSWHLPAAELIDCFIPYFFERDVSSFIALYHTSLINSSSFITQFMNSV